MRAKRHIVLLVCLLALTAVFAQEAKTSFLRVEKVGEERLEVHFEMHGVQVTLAGWNFSVMECRGMTLGNGQVGAPNLPTASTLVRLPAGSLLTVGRVTGDSVLAEDFAPKGFPFAPVTRAWSKENEWPGYEPDAKIYATDEYYRGGDLVEVEYLGRMGGEEVFRLTVRPVAYNPVRRSVMGWERVDCELILESNSRLIPSRGDRRILIVSRPEFEAGLQPFVQWKLREGYAVEELYVETHRRDSIKEMMRPYFQNDNPLTPAPDYVLLVGDAPQIQSFIGETTLEGESHTTDLYYVDFSDDYLPEALLGRWPVNDTTELRRVVEKTLRYEQFRDMDTLQLKRMMLVAGREESSIAPLTTNGQVNYIKREVKQAHPETDTLCYYNPQSATMLDNIISDLGIGVSLVNYTAHCTVGGWDVPPLTIGGVDEAQSTQPTVYVNNCCKSNTFSGTGFGEQILRVPVGGGVGVIGATNSTLWYEDYYWAVGPKWPVSLNAPYDSTARGAFDALAGSQPTIATMGELLAAGNLAVTAFGTGYDKYYWEIYCLLGDPTLKPWIGVPQAIDLQLANELHNGQSEVSVNGTAGATVSVMQGNEVLGHAVIDSLGMATISLNRTLDTQPVILTTTGTGLWPRVDTVSVDTVDLGVTLRNVMVSDSMVHCTVENIGNVRIDSLHVALTQSDAHSDGALLEEQVVVTDSLLPHCQVEVTLPVTVVEIGQLPMWRASLVAWSNGTNCRLELAHSLPTVYPTLGLRLLETDGRQPRRVLPGHEYQLEAVADGQIDSMNLLAVANANTPLVNLTTQLSPLVASFTTPDSLCALGLSTKAYLGQWVGREHYWLEPCDRIESFEHGFDSHPWQNGERVAWVIDSTESHSGSFSARSGVVDHGQRTTLCLEVEMPLRDTISYWLKTSTEAQHDKLVFSVDGRDYTPAAWGIDGWRKRTHVMEAGTHKLCWSYRKDASNSQGDDCVWIDDLQIPLALWDTAYVWDCTTTPVAIEDNPLTHSATLLTLYPNPSFGEIWLDGPQGAEIHICDALGREVAHLTLNGAPQMWDAAAMPAGVYFATSMLGARQHTVKIILIKQ